MDRGHRRSRNSWRCHQYGCDRIYGLDRTYGSYGCNRKYRSNGTNRCYGIWSYRPYWLDRLDRLDGSYGSWCDRPYGSNRLDGPYRSR